MAEEWANEFGRKVEEILIRRTSEVLSKWNQQSEGIKDCLKELECQLVAFVGMTPHRQSSARMEGGRAEVVEVENCDVHGSGNFEKAGSNGRAVTSGIRFMEELHGQNKVDAYVDAYAWLPEIEHCNGEEDSGGTGDERMRHRMKSRPNLESFSVEKDEDCVVVMHNQLTTLRKPFAEAPIDDLDCGPTKKPRWPRKKPRYLFNFAVANGDCVDKDMKRWWFDPGGQPIPGGGRESFLRCFYMSVQA